MDNIMPSMGPKEPSSAETALSVFLNTMEQGWGDHYRQATGKAVGVVAGQGDEVGAIADTVLEVSIAPDCELDEDDEAEEGQAWDSMIISMEMRDRGQEEAKEALTIKMPCDRDYRLTAEDDRRLSDFLNAARDLNVNGIPAVK